MSRRTRDHADERLRRLERRAERRNSAERRQYRQNGGVR
jgi:hypothetical protein